MIDCPICKETFPNNYLFCLNCGHLLRNYKAAYNKPLNDDEFNNMVNKFSDAVDDFQKIMSRFSNKMDINSEKMNKSSEDFSFEAIPYNQHVSNLKEIFMDLSQSFEETIDNLQDVMFEMLAELYVLNNSGEELDDGESFQAMIASLEGLIASAKDAKSSSANLELSDFNADFENVKLELLGWYDKYILFFERSVNELKYIKDKRINNNHMTTEDNHNHFCIYCGAPLDPNQHFCSQCGKEVYHEAEPLKVKMPSKYTEKVNEIEQEYNFKQEKATELVGKLFDPSHLSYQKFTAAIKKSNGLFDNQLTVTRKMIELDDGENSIIEKEIEGKLVTLNTFIDKMEDLINELVIQLSSNKDDDEDINALFNDMDDLIGSVKDY